MSLNVVLVFALCLTVQSLSTIENADDLFKFSESSPLNVVVFVDRNRCLKKEDLKCVQQRETLKQIEELMINEKLDLAISNNFELAEKKFNLFGNEPKLCFFRHGFPIVYSNSLENIEQVQEWLGETRERLTRTLDDRSFEHDTQAATGSTTGDWFILFKKSNDSRGLIPVWESISFRFRHRVIFAYVDLDKNPITQKRFHIFNLPTFILFKRGQMFRYEGSSWKLSSFIDFLEQPELKAKAEAVPTEPSALSIFFESLPRAIPIYLVIVPMICLLAVLLFLSSGIIKRIKPNVAQRPPNPMKID